MQRVCPLHDFHRCYILMFLINSMVVVPSAKSLILGEKLLAFFWGQGLEGICRFVWLALHPIF